MFEVDVDVPQNPCKRREVAIEVLAICLCGIVVWCVYSNLAWKHLHYRKQIQTIVRDQAKSVEDQVRR
jgi:hypothetical protein